MWESECLSYVLCQNGKLEINLLNPKICDQFLQLLYDYWLAVEVRTAVTWAAAQSFNL